MRVLRLVSLTVFFVALATACQSPQGNAPAAQAWSGFLEGTTIDVSSEVAGRITMIAVQEGDRVQSGQLLLTLDDEFVRLRMDAADANVAAAQAQLALLESGARAEDIRLAQARVDQARAAYLAASQAVTDTEAVRSNPQALIIAKTDMEARAIAASLQLTATARQAEAADLEHQFWQDQNKTLDEGKDIRLPNGTVIHFDTPSARITYARDEWNKAGNRAWQAWASVSVADANASMAMNGLKDISDQLSNPIGLDNRVSQARAGRTKAQAGLLAAEAALQILREGASPSQIQAARAALDQARAARATIDQELTRYQITAPSAGTVIRLAYRDSEIVAPTAPIVRIALDGVLKLRVFVSFAQIEQVHVGDTVRIFVTELGNRALAGKVTSISDRAEFTGRQAQTDSERNAQLVAVEIAVQDADNQVKAGMPASVMFGGTSPGTELGPPSAPGMRESLVFSGSLENKSTRIAAEVSARAVSVHRDLGGLVKVGDPLIELDDTTIRTTASESEAAVRAAQASLDQVNEAARPGALALAEAGMAQAKADLDAANVALDTANRTLKSPQDLIAQLHIWEGKVNASQGEFQRAQATLAGIKSQVQLAANDSSTFGKTRYAMLQRQQDAAALALTAAQTTLEGNQHALGLTRQTVDNPLEILGNEHASANQVKVAEAGARVAQANLEITKRGPQKEAVMLAEAKLRAARAAQSIVQAQLKRYSVASPLEGQVVTRNVQEGETVRAGTPLLTIADSHVLEMTVYVPIRNLGAIKLQQTGTLRVPSLADRTYSATVTFIAPEAEFKPANIYNSKERSELVYAVRVTLINPGEELKAGLPADLIF